MFETHLSNIRFTSKGDAGDDFFSSSDGGGYVPSGLTREQYEAIKKEEQEKQKKMNYGAWGPRFSASERPAGDWMVIPSLWVTGFTNSQARRDTDRSPNGEKPTRPTYDTSILSKIALGFAMLDFTLAVSYMLHKKREASLLAMTLFKIKRIPFNVSIKAILRYTMLKITIVSILVKFMTSLAERTRKSDRESQKK